MRLDKILIFAIFLCFGLTGCYQSEPRAADLEMVSVPSGAKEKIEITPSLTSSITPSPSPSPTSSLTPLPPSTTPVYCLSDTGRAETKKLETSWLKENLEYRVYTPPCYDPFRKKGYPVLYLIHGYGYNDDQWERLGVDDVSNDLMGTGDLPPFIIVMPHDRNHNFQPPENQFGEALVNDLVVAIDNEFNTSASKPYRAIGGLSRGGNWAIHIGLTYWSTFGVIGGHSAPLFVSDGPPKVREWLDNIPTESYPRIFMDVGERDKWLDHIIRFEEMLDEYNIPHELYIFPGGHSEDYWSSHTEQYLRWYAKDW